MSIVKPDRTIPESIVNQVREIEIKAVSQFNFRNFIDSNKKYEEMLTLFLVTQVKIGRPIHKGTPYHMIGINYTATNSHAKAVQNILLAYIEDTLNSEYGEENEADTTPAGQMLKNYYHIHEKLLGDLKDKAKEIKLAGDWGVLFDPNDIYDEFKIRFQSYVIPKTSKDIQTPESHPLGFPELWEKRVFIGGSYQTHWSHIKHLEKIVADLGYTPVVAFDVEMPRDKTHHHTLLLLHTCKYAIFEISTPAGQLMEIERTLDYENTVLCLFNTLPNKDSAYVSSMLKTMNHIQLESYSTLQDIDVIIKNYLPSLGR